VEDLEVLQNQHYNNYVEVVKEIIGTNTLSLIENDINPLFKQPPLDSMDQIKTKFLITAKKEKLILETDQLNKILQDFRNNIGKELKKIIDVRNNELIGCLKDLVDNKKILKVTKSQMNEVDKKIKKIIKSEIEINVKKYILNRIDAIFKKSDTMVIQKALKDIQKYFDSKGIYQKQLLESIDFKLLVKDTILLNGIKEQTERYLFTLNNSRIFNN